MNHTFYKIDHEEGPYNSGADFAEGNIGHRPGIKGGYFPVPPNDTLQDIRSEMVLTMESCGINVECHHHEVASGGQCEIDMRFAPLVEMADALVLLA